MAESVLITIADVRNYRKKVDLKIDDFDEFAGEIQRNNLRQLFGDALYYDFMNDDRTSGKYEELLNGKTYTYDGNTINYYGLKPMLCYWWLAKFITEGEIYHSQHGSIQFTNNPQQNFEETKQKRTVASSYMETAQNYANDVIQFLNQNSSTYPLWKSQDKGTRSQFVSFRL